MMNVINLTIYFRYKRNWKLSIGEEKILWKASMDGDLIQEDGFQESNSNPK